MKSFIIAALVALLVISNLFWLYVVVDTAVTRSYADQEMDVLKKANAQAVGMLKTVLEGKTKSQVELAAMKFSELEPYEKEGCLWIGWYGFKFSETGLFMNLETDESYNDNPICREETPPDQEPR
ncbi:hypothetical protein [Pseudomonas purpurea]|uniref:hypothetical protein n=1 Tax=Pseudomonas purpurea TaxID=3136737 RepID=UPI00326468D8